MSIKMPLVLLWPSKDDYYGIGQSEALHFIQLTKKCDIMSHVESLKQKESEYIDKIKPIVEKREKRLKAGFPVDVILSDLLHLKKEQRKVRQFINVAYIINSWY
jgi:hypothetical protein